MPDFDNTQTNRFTFEATEDTIAWTVNGNPYASWTIGSDESLWPLSSGQPQVLSFAAWAK